jgi:hypothetical protein
VVEQGGHGATDASACGAAPGAARRLGGAADRVRVIEKRREENDDGDDDFKSSARARRGLGLARALSLR